MFPFRSIRATGGEHEENRMAYQHTDPTLYIALALNAASPELRQALGSKDLITKEAAAGHLAKLVAAQLQRRFTIEFVERPVGQPGVYPRARE